MKSCLIIEDMHPGIFPLMEAIGYQCDYRPDINPSDVSSIIGNYDGLFIRSKMRIDKKLLVFAKKLRFIARAGSGMDIIDTEYATEKNIHLINSPEGNRDAVGEHALGLLLCLMNKIHSGDVEVKGKIWEREQNRGHEVKNKTVAIIGYGNMGKSFAKKLSGFECKVLGYDKYLSDYSDQYVAASNMEEIFSKSDIISFHIPLTDETQDMINETYLSKFKKPIWLINTSRGKVLNLSDLVIAIERGAVRGAALDVLENENIKNFKSDEVEIFEKLAKMKNVVLTPHVAGWTYESYQRINEVLVEKIAKMRE